MTTAVKTHITRIMGVLNTAPDSFYPASRVASPDEARARATQMIADGAHMIDVGGESSRPGAKPVGLEAEIERVVPVVECLAGLDAIISVDTYRSETARRAIAVGARMVNDITGLRGDPDMAGVIADAEAECVIMHMRGTPETMQRDPVYTDVVDDIRAFFDERITFAVRSGIDEARIWIDPGFGFGKTVEHNLELLRRLSEFRVLGRPLLVGTSNKSIIGAVLGLSVEDRLEGTAATVVVSIMNGADAVRVHDVKAMARVARMTDAVLGKLNHG